MAAGRRPHDPPQQATAVTHPLRQPPRRPWRWGRLLAAGLALVVVAALVPRALADDSGPMVASGAGESQTLDVTAQAEAMTETLEPDPGEAEVSVSPERTGVDGKPGADTAKSAQGTGSEDHPTGEGEQKQPPTQEPIVVAERNLARQEQSDQHDATVTDGVGDPAKPPPGGQDQGDPTGPGQQADANQRCGADGSCTAESPGSGAATVAAAGGAAGGGVGGWARGLWNSGLEKLGLRSPPQEATPQEPSPATQERMRKLDLVEEDIRLIERREGLLAADGRRVRSPAEQVEDWQAQMRSVHTLGQVRREFEQQGWATATPEEGRRFSDLQRRWTWTLGSMDVYNRMRDTPLDRATREILEAEFIHGLREAEGTWGILDNGQSEVRGALREIQDARSAGSPRGARRPSGWRIWSSGRQSSSSRSTR